MRTTVRIRTRDRWLAVLALLAFLLVCFAVTAAPEHKATPTTTVTLTPNSQAKKESARPIDDLHGVPSKHHWHLWTLPWNLLRKLSVVVGAAGLVLLIWLIVRWLPQLSRGRLGRRAPPTDESEPDPEIESNAEVSQALSRALVAIELGDANRAIVACWIRLEQIAEETGFARQPWETSTELVTRWLGLASVPAEPLDDLAELYREARYSGHAMSPESVERARSTVTRLRQAFVLTERGRDAASANSGSAGREASDG